MRDTIDTRAARKLILIQERCKDRGLTFNLSFRTTKRILMRKTCYFTGLPLDKNTITFDRIDNSIGYEEGNVVACHTCFNKLKGVIENTNNDLDMRNTYRGIKKWIQCM